MSLMKAKFVYDGEEDSPTIPEEMGTPKDSQFQGTPREQTAELCGRVCYDSLGKGRGSDEYHKHIHEVKHLSVYEHTPITVSFTIDEDMLADFLLACANRPGVYIRVLPGIEFRVTANFRTILEWKQRINAFQSEPQKIEQKIGNSLKAKANEVAPMCVPIVPHPTMACQRVKPDHDHEKWITLFMGGSRGFSHEQVRHGDYTAISQRSTRYVDESGSDWVWHPLIREYLSAEGESASPFSAELEETQKHCGRTYDQIVDALQPWLINRGVDKLNARKQARGAARGFLGNALYTEMMFSASVGQWLWMIQQRGSKFADAEIREVYSRETESVLSALRESRFANSFSGLEIVESPDGIGTIIQERS